jgi:hypothetical protein
MPYLRAVVRYGFVMFWYPSRDLSTMFSAFAAGAVLAASFLYAPGADADPSVAERPGAPVVGAAPIVEAAPIPAPEAVPAPVPAAVPAPVPEAVPAPAPEAVPVPAPEAAPVADAANALPADGLIVVPAAHVDISPQVLPPGVCNEEGLQVKTILVERAVSAEFPQIHSMVGVRPDAKPWHPNGLAIDIMIPDSGSAAGIELGDAIRDFALSNADRFGVQDVIWRGTYYTPGGPGGSGYGHYDHVHTTTVGGGYPSGGEQYLSAG